MLITQVGLTQAAQLLPFVLPLAYGAVLPRPQTVKALTEEEVATSPIQTYAPVPTEENEDEERLEPTQGIPRTHHSHLTIQDKWKLVKPLLLLYMLPLCELARCARS
jgi:battenin